MEDTPSTPGRDVQARAVQYVEEILQEAAADTGPPRQPPDRRRLQLVLLLILVPPLAALSMWNIIRSRGQPEVVTVAEETQDARFTLFVISQEIDAYIDSSGAPPLNLRQLDADEEEVQYLRVGNSYLLVYRTDNVELSYRPGDDLTPFEEAYIAVVNDAP